ncbi:MAG: hypothetical protein C4576_33030 [Desulfobacteraceae bacterium]|nr:MAG: hypothetical protein C4576_33030 [Desulfobacteraceae bacterium]
MFVKGFIAKFGILLRPERRSPTIRPCVEVVIVEESLWKGWAGYRSLSTSIPLPLLTLLQKI